MYQPQNGLGCFMDQAAILHLYYSPTFNVFSPNGTLFFLHIHIQCLFHCCSACLITLSLPLKEASSFTQYVLFVDKKDSNLFPIRLWPYPSPVKSKYCVKLPMQISFAIVIITR